jgi:hypothetical protein
VLALGIQVRAGLHTGECEVRGDDNSEPFAATVDDLDACLIGSGAAAATIACSRRAHAAASAHAHPPTAAAPPAERTSETR